MNIREVLIPKEHTRIRPGIPMKPEYITVHETANTNKGANAAAHARLLSSGNTRVASWHFTVDDHEIVQHLPTNEVGWHAGDGRDGTGNRKSIGIEICVNSDGDYDKAVANAIELVKFLMAKHNIPVEKVVPHRHWTGKNCPANLLKRWNWFIDQLKQKPQPQPKPQPNPVIPPFKRYLKLTSPMMRGDDVKMVQRKLGGLVVDGIYGPKTRDAVIRFQQKKGLLVDGIVGPQTWEALFS